MGVLRTILLRLIRDEIAKHRHMDVHQYGSEAGPKSTVVFDKIDPTESAAERDLEKALQWGVWCEPLDGRGSGWTRGTDGDDVFSNEAEAKRQAEAFRKHRSDTATYTARPYVGSTDTAAKALEKCEVMHGEQELAVPPVPLHGAPVSSREAAGVSGVQGRHGVLDVADDSSGKGSVARRREEAPVKTAHDAAKGPPEHVYVSRSTDVAGGVWTDFLRAFEEPWTGNRVEFVRAEVVDRRVVGAVDRALKRIASDLGAKGANAYETARRVVASLKATELDLSVAKAASTVRQCTIDRLERELADAQAKVAAIAQHRDALEARVRKVDAKYQMLFELESQAEKRAGAAEARVLELETEHRAALEALGPIGGTGLVGMVIATRARASTTEGECGRLEKELGKARSKLVTVKRERDEARRELEDYCAKDHAVTQATGDTIDRLQAQHEADAKEITRLRAEALTDEQSEFLADLINKEYYRTQNKLDWDETPTAARQALVIRADLAIDLRELFMPHIRAAAAKAKVKP